MADTDYLQIDMNNYNALKDINNTIHQINIDSTYDTVGRIMAL